LPLRAEVWALLGIAETFDKAAIRRAYAARMRAIDMETGREAFVALRAAYETALTYEDEASLSWIFDGLDDFAPGQDETDAPPPRDDLVAQRPAAPTEVLELEAFLDEMAIRPLRPIEQMEEIVAKSGVAAAWRVFLGWLANGDISVSEQNGAAAALLAQAVKDERLPRETFIEMTKVLGLSAHRRKFETHPELTDAIDDRLAVYRWFDGVKADAAEKPRGKRKHKIRAARALLRQDKKFPRKYETRLALKLLIDTYRSHESVLHDVLEPEFLARLEARTSKVLRRSYKIQLTWVSTAVIALIGDLVFQLCRDAVQTISFWLAH
jgi:hypothetical protein